MRKEKVKRWAAAIMLALISFSGWQCEDGVNLFSIEDDIALGRQLRDEILSNPSEYPVIPRAQAPEAYAFVENMRNQILQYGDLKYADKFDWEVYLIHDDQVLNAFCAPGGYIFIYTGIIKYLNSTHELMGVLGHEMAHADERHSTGQLTKAYGLQLLTSILLGENYALLSEIANGLIGLEFSRSDEREADACSVRYMCRTPYKADGAAAFFAQMIADGSGGGVPTFLSTHPDPGNRVNDIQALAAELGCSGNNTGTTDYETFKNMLP